MRKARITLAALLAFAAIVSAVPRTAAAETCPTPEFCLILLDGGCTCEGYYCNGQFYCAIPHWP